jgi:superfamily II DNA or RNA helicase
MSKEKEEIKDNESIKDEVLNDEEDESIKDEVLNDEPDEADNDDNDEVLDDNDDDDNQDDDNEDDDNQDDDNEDDDNQDDDNEDDNEDEDNEDDNEDEDNEDEDNEDEDNEDEDEDNEDEDEDKDEDKDEDEEDSKKKFKEDEDFLKGKKANNEELNNLFKNNINNRDPNELTIDVLKKNKNLLKTKKDLQYYLNAFELLNSLSMNKNMGNYYDNYDYLYPHLDDELLNLKISQIQQFKEFKNNVDLDKISSIEEEANKLCNKEFELSPHQQFIKNFLSSYTPYNSLLLYHGLGTGKTCSAIGIAEETREFMKLNGINQRIIIVASPSVQENFKLQLFDERKLKSINGIWEINNCAGNNFLKEINMLKNDISREKVIKIVNNTINNYYLFMGYIEFANLISKKSNIEKQKTEKTEKTEKSNNENLLVKNKLQKFFGNRLIIIDEIHNIRESNNDSANKLVSKQLFKLVKYVDNMKLVVMSATPMYNDYKEIIYLTNLLNLNDKRSIIEINDVFDNDGNFVKSINGEESGKELLKRKLNGYVSYVKGDNPFIFPYRILPNDFNSEKSIKNIEYPIQDLNNVNINDKIRLLDIYMNYTSLIQNNIYNYIIYKLNLKDYKGYKYTDLQKPLQALNIVYPNKILETSSINDYPKIDIKIEDLIGKTGLYSVIENIGNKKSEYKFKIKDKQENIFLKENIGNYSCKIKTILDSIENSEGPIIIYSQFIESGLIPLALALESNGFKKYDKNNLFKSPPIESKKNSNYIMITGDKILTPNLKSDLNATTNENNKEGNIVKVILLSMAGSEGIDFKFIRQIHIMEPWYNMNRIEQIIGRGVRTCSHKDLPLNKRNVKIYMHGSLLEDRTIETMDLMLYKRCEEKAIKIGKITRLMKTLSVDCYLNSDLQKYNSENMKQLNENGLELILSNGEIINFFVGDKKDSPLCDYMEDCNYDCNNYELKDSIDDSNSLINYNENFITMNNELIIKKLKLLFLEKYFYTKFEIIKNLTEDSFSFEAINYSLTELINNDNIIINDKYNRPGRIINIDDLYIYQPLEINNENSSLASKITPINFNTENLEFKVPDNVKKPIDRKKYNMSNVKVVDKFKEDDIYTSRTGNKNIIFDNLLENYKNIINYKKDFLKTIKNKKDHIILLAELFNVFKNKKDSNNLFNFESNNTSLDEITIVKKYIFEIIINVLLDKLTFNDHKSLIEFIYNLSEEFLYENEDEKNLLIFLKNYYDSNLIENNDLRGFIFNTLIVEDIYINASNKDNKFIFFILNKNNVLELAKPYDYENNLNDVIKRKYNIDFSSDTNAMGFLKQYKNDINYDYDFKIKLLKDSKTPGLYNSGKVCTTFAQKNKESEIDLTKIVESLEIYNLPKLTTSLYCILIEVILRYYSLIKKDDKLWFYDFNYSLINKFYA